MANIVALVGRLTKDPDSRQTTTGKTVTSFSLAVDKRGKDAGASFFDVEAWGKTAETIANYAKKGSQVFVSGRLDQQTWTDKQTGQKRSKVIIVADNFEFVGSKQTTGQSQPMPQVQAISPQALDAQDQIRLEDLPF